MIQKKINNRPRQKLNFKHPNMSSTKEYCNFALDGCLHAAIKGGGEEDGGGLSLIGSG